MPLIDRDLSKELLEMASIYPVVTLIGPRQSGKTTLVRLTFPNKPYVSLENPDEQHLAESDPRGFLGRFPNGAILDEIQRQPALLSYIQGIVDERQEQGLFIVTGSHQASLQQSVTQSLAGRTAVLTLLPLSLDELQKICPEKSIDDYLYCGMYPKIHQNKINPTKYYRDYVHTYLERDVRQMLNVKDLSLFQSFLKLCAGRVGQVFNASSLGNDLGISYHTIQNWLSILEASFIIFRLQPYFENFGKRVIKSPKLYFHDVGVLTYLLGITSVEQLFRDPLRGSLIENFVISELRKVKINQGVEPDFYYFRENNQQEVDLLIKEGNEFIPVEIKASKTFHSDFLKGLIYFKKLSADRCRPGYLIYAGHQEQKMDTFFIKNLFNLKSILTEL